MSVTPLDLSELDKLPEFGGQLAVGTPMLLDLERVHEDPNQPRKTFDGIVELAAVVAEVGVKVPISVRPHPVMEGHYMVKFGARRRRAAIAAGLTHIPAWLDEAPSDFEQVIENLQRADLTPMELAIFMSEKISAGMKQGEIARRLGIHRTQIPKHMALIDAPAEVEAVYRSGRSTSPETIFELRSVYSQFPEETKAWLAEDTDVSRRSVEALKLRLTAGGKSSAEAQSSRRTKSTKDAPPADPSEIKRPVVVIQVGDRLGIAVLNRRATAFDHILVKWDDTAEIVEVPSRDVALLRIDDARRYEPINRGLTPVSDPTTSRPAEPTSHL
jgi:ParB family chromosome partitioning protein